MVDDRSRVNDHARVDDSSARAGEEAAIASDALVKQNLAFFKNQNNKLKRYDSTSTLKNSQEIQKSQHLRRLLKCM